MDFRLYTPSTFSRVACRGSLKRSHAKACWNKLHSYREFFLTSWKRARQFSFDLVKDKIVYEASLFGILFCWGEIKLFLITWPVPMVSVWILLPKSIMLPKTLAKWKYIFDKNLWDWPSLSNHRNCSLLWLLGKTKLTYNDPRLAWICNIVF